MTIRLANIDAPEKAQPFGAKSSQALATLCFQQWASIKAHQQDRYGRTVADVECQGQDGGRHQVAQGMAWVFDRYVIDRSLYTVQAAAQAGKVGLWSDADAVPPWEWRRASRTDSAQ